MSFFRWIPDGSTDIVSPWIAVYFGLTAVITGATFWRWKTWKIKDAHGIEEFIDGVNDQGDVEKGSLYSESSRNVPIGKERHNSDDTEMTMVPPNQHITW